MKEVVTAFKPFGICPCVPGCGREGKYQARTFRDGVAHVRGCDCKQCRGRRVGRNGKSGQATAVTRLGVPKIGKLRPGHEEHMGGTMRIEVKSGAQVRPLVTAFEKAERQSEMQRPIGDTRPFFFAAVPQPNGKDVIYAFRTRSRGDLEAAALALAGQLNLFGEGDQ